MCLYIQSGPHVAERNIPVRKIIRITNDSAYNYFRYKPNKLYELFLGLKPDGNIITGGFHSYGPDVVIKKGWHYKVYANHDSADNNDYFDWFTIEHHKIVDFIIPEGTEYYIGDSGDYVSAAILSGSLEPKTP